MKKILAIMLAVSMGLSLVACGGDKPANTDSDIQTEIEMEEPKVDAEGEELDEPTKEPEIVVDDKTENKKEEKPTKKPSKAPEKAPEATKAPEETKVPESKPTETPEATKTTLGKTLLKAFKSQDSTKSADSIAEALLSNPAILFGGGVMPVEEGLLSGFDNAEIKGFKSGAMFAPMIGSIPFVGYIFELENAADASSFVKNLEKNANKRWNICVEADEMVTGISGNKVFFVMCPESLEE